MEMQQRNWNSHKSLKEKDKLEDYLISKINIKLQ
jgi:hypothetical protein